MKGNRKPRNQAQLDALAKGRLKSIETRKAYAKKKNDEKTDVTTQVNDELQVYIDLQHQLVSFARTIAPKFIEEGIDQTRVHEILYKQIREFKII